MNTELIECMGINEVSWTSIHPDAAHNDGINATQGGYQGVVRKVINFNYFDTRA
jgi:hypothetical protein